MVYIAQEHEYGCAVACVATILSITYHDALVLFEEKGKVVDTGFYCRDIISAFERVERSYLYYYIKPYKRKLIYTDETIVYVKKGRIYPAGHYFVRKDGVWIDPWINFPNFPIKAGARNRLPETPIYALQPQKSE